MYIQKYHVKDKSKGENYWRYNIFYQNDNEVLR